MENKFCRRCGGPLVNKQDHFFVCDKGHEFYANAAPTTIAFLVNDQKEVLTVVRKYDPGKGKLDWPGGFCDGAETFEAALAREIAEEVGLTPEDYETPQYLTSVIDPYTYKGETLNVICAVFWSKLRSGVIIRPGGDVSEAMSLSFDKIDQNRIHFTSQIGLLKKLQAMHVLK